MAISLEDVRALKILDEWDEMYENEGSECPFPDDFVETCYPELYVFFTNLFVEAEQHFKKNPEHFGFNTDFDVEDFQGYHDEWEILVQSAREVLEARKEAS